MSHDISIGKLGIGALETAARMAFLAYARKDAKPQSPPGARHEPAIQLIPIGSWHRQ